tara:strand:- start:225 stop:620 length:396 start_codon:yes stop_codon:yes gene_type:complete
MGKSLFHCFLGVRRLAGVPQFLELGRMMEEREKRDKAWVGDAVLALFAREWLLRQVDIKAGDRKAMFINMTSNHFLASFGEPTAIEAKIGVVYENEGLKKAFSYIEETYLPVFKKQEKNRNKTGSHLRRKV